MEAFWKPLFAYAQAPGPETEAAARQAFTEKEVRWQYEHGVPDASLVSPDAWRHALEVLARPGNDENQLHLFQDYKTNLDVYPQAQESFRQTQVPLLAVWGANDQIFGPDGARAFQRDLPNAEVHLLDTGHFALETHVDEIATRIRDFLGRMQVQPAMAR